MIPVGNENLFQRAFARRKHSVSGGSSLPLLFLKKQQFIFPLEVLIISVKYSLFLSWNFFSSFGCSGVAASWASVVYFYSFGKKKKVLEKKPHLNGSLCQQRSLKVLGKLLSNLELFLNSTVFLVMFNFSLFHLHSAPWSLA